MTKITSKGEARQQSIYRISIAVTGGILLVLIFTHLFSGFSQVGADSVHCQACTHIITDYDASTYTLTGGELICITRTGNFVGRIHRAKGREAARICNEGIFNPTLISLNAGINYIDNYGDAQPGIVNLNPGQKQTTITNHSGGRFAPAALNLHYSGSTFDNYGDFSPANLSIAHGATVYNHASGKVSTHTFSLKGNSLARNDGNWVIRGNIVRDRSSRFENQGQVENWPPEAL